MSAPQERSSLPEVELNPCEVSETAMRNRRALVTTSSTDSEAHDAQPSPPQPPPPPTDGGDLTLYEQRKFRKKKYCANAPPEDFPYGQYDSPLTDEEDIRQHNSGRRYGRRSYPRRTTTSNFRPGGGGRPYRAATWAHADGGLQNGDDDNSWFNPPRTYRPKFRGDAATNRGFRGFGGNTFSGGFGWGYDSNSDYHDFRGRRSRRRGFDTGFRDHSRDFYVEPRNSFNSPNNQHNGSPTRRRDVNSGVENSNFGSPVTEKTWYNRSMSRGSPASVKSAPRSHASHVDNNSLDRMTVERSVAVDAVQESRFTEVIIENSKALSSATDELSQSREDDDKPLSVDTVSSFDDSISHKLCQLCQIHVAEEEIDYIRQIKQAVELKEVGVQVNLAVSRNNAITQTSAPSMHDVALATSDDVAAPAQVVMVAAEQPYVGAVPQSGQYSPYPMAQGNVRMSPQFIAPAEMGAVMPQGQMPFAYGGYVQQPPGYGMGPEQYFLVTSPIQQPPAPGYDPRIFNVNPGVQFPGR